jgi:hypothetical protein
MEEKMKQNITLSIDKEIIKKGKVIAAQRDTSISRMLNEMLKGIVEKEEEYEAAKRRALQALNKGFHLGGSIDWKREELYER